MKTTIYCFSATGNSLKLARDVQSALGDCDVVSIAQALRGHDLPRPGERIGLVFPVFAWGLPRMVVDFVERLDLRHARYIFAITTCVAIPGNTLRELQSRLEAKGSFLHAGFAVSASRSSLMKMNRLDKIMIRIDGHRKDMRRGEERLHEIVEKIRELKELPPESSSWAANTFGSMFHGPALKRFRNMDAQFMVDESCGGCGTCVKVCPRANIRLNDGHPVFKHDCELCHACIQWCPRFAIRHPGFDAKPRQYHNPAIQVADMVHP